MRWSEAVSTPASRSVVSGHLGGRMVELDIAHEPSEPLAPRDLVDLFFLDQAGFPPDASLEAALKKDDGIDPAILSMLLLDFPTAPLPHMLRDLNQQRLAQFRTELAARFKAATLPQARDE